MSNPTFTAGGRVWLAGFTDDTEAAALHELSVRLADLAALRPDKLLDRLRRDPHALGGLLYLACRGACEARGLTPEAFVAQLNYANVSAATGAAGAAGAAAGATSARAVRSWSCTPRTTPSCAPSTALRRGSVEATARGEEGEQEPRRGKRHDDDRGSRARVQDDSHLIDTAARRALGGAAPALFSFRTDATSAGGAACVSFAFPGHGTVVLHLERVPGGWACGSKPWGVGSAPVRYATLGDALISAAGG